MANNNNRKNAARKAARTVKTRRDFVKKFSVETLYALADIVQNVEVWNDFRKRSLAAYKANLTRGTYNAFVTVGSTGSITRDRLGLARMS